MDDPVLRFVEVAGRELRCATWGSGRAEIVMLHDGLGSIPQWRAVPAELHRRTGAAVLAYERAGHGASTPVPAGAWPADWLHREADVLDQLIDGLDLDRPVLVGHSDGGSIALIHAAAQATDQATDHGADGSDRIAGVVAIAAHSWVEDICAGAIRSMRADRDRFETGLARFHDHPAAVFEAWSGVWVSEGFADWDIRPMIGAITCPTVIAQGVGDEYATAAQVTDTVAAIGCNADAQFIEGAGHIVHHQAPEAVVDMVTAFYDRHRGASGPAQGD